MEIILRKEDLERMLRKHYSSVKEIKFSGKNPRVVLIMEENVTSVLPSKQVEPQSVTPNNIPAQTVETPVKSKPQTNNTMSSERRIVNI